MPSVLPVLYNSTVIDTEQMASKAIAVPENHSWTEKPLPVEHLAPSMPAFLKT